MKEHINFICKTAFLEIRRISTIRHHLTDNATKTLVSLVLSRIDYCNSLLAGLPQSLVGKLQRVQNSAALLVVRAVPHVPSLRYPDIFTGCLLQPGIPIRQHATVSTPPSPPSLLIFLTLYIYILLLDLFTPVPTPASSKCHSISARQKVIVLSLTLVLLSGMHCCCTLEMLQLSTPSGLL